MGGGVKYSGREFDPAPMIGDNMSRVFTPSPKSPLSKGKINEEGSRSKNRTP